MCCLRALRLAVLLFALSAGWATQAASRACVGVVAAGATPFWQEVEAGSQQAGRDLDVDVYFRGPSREGRVESQLQMIDWIEAHGCKALVIAPSGARIAQRVRELEARGIATIYFDRDLTGSPVRGLVSTDNYRAGQLAGQYMATQLGGQGQVALLRLQPGVHSTSERERGFRQAAEAGGLLILVDRYVGEDSQAVVSAVQRELEHLDGLFTPNSTSSRAALAAMRRLPQRDTRAHLVHARQAAGGHKRVVARIDHQGRNSDVAQQRCGCLPSKALRWGSSTATRCAVWRWQKNCPHLAIGWFLQARMWQ